MRYKSPSQHETRELRRLWLVKVYEGDKDDPKCKIREERIIAWNSTEAIRQVPGDIAELPESLGFVTWDKPAMMIHSTKEGATDVKADSTISNEEEDWDF